MITPPVFLDANVYFSKILLIVFVDMAENELFTLLWSNEVLTEVDKNWQAKYGYTNATNTINAIKSRFFSGEVLKTDYQQEESLLVKTHQKDRHILAAAAVAGAKYLVTFNLSDFDVSEASKLKIHLIHPDDYLSHIYDQDFQRVISSFRGSRTRLNRPPLTENEFLERLKTANVSTFSNKLSSQLGSL